MEKCLDMKLVIFKNKGVVLRLKKYKLSFDDCRDDLLRIIFCELDLVLSWYGEYGYPIRIDGSTVFGVYAFCH